MKFSSKKPNLFIAGAPKAGTTFLYQQLQNHPQLFFPKVKELNFFSYQKLDEIGSYYNDFRITSIEKYLKLFEKSSDEKYLVDTSVSYFSFKESAQKIYHFNKNAKVIFILRNPIKRAFSHFLMDKRMGHAQLPFKEYLNNPDRFSFHFHQYVEISRYYKNIINYSSLFRKENIHILFLEELNSSLIHLCNFLDIDYGALAIQPERRVNTGKVPKNIISHFFYKNRNFTIRLKQLLPENVSSLPGRFLYSEEIKPDIGEEEYHLLLKYLTSDIRNLTNFTGRDLPLLWKIDI